MPATAMTHPNPAQSPPTPKPLLVSAKRAREIIDVKETKFWALVKAGRIKMVDAGGRRLVSYASLESLAGQ